MENDTLGGRVKELRRSLDLSQGELGGLVGGMSQSWVSRVEKNQLTPDHGQMGALESVLGSLTRAPQSTNSTTGDPSRGPAVYKASRLATENMKRRADLALRMERLQTKELTSNEMLIAERESAVAFIRKFVEQAVELPIDVLADLQSHGIGGFDVVDDETQDLVDARNGVVQQLGIQLRAASPTGTSAGATTGETAVIGVFTAVEAFAAFSTWNAIGSLSRAALSTVTALRAGSTAAGGLGAAGGIGAAGGLAAAGSIGIAAAPALIAAGVAITVAGRRLLTRAQDERSQLLEAALELDQLQVVIDEYCTQSETVASLLIHARKYGTDELNRLRERVATGVGVEIEPLVKVVALILTVLPLPVPGGPSESAPLGTTHRANELALETAESWMVEAGALN